MNTHLIIHEIGPSVTLQDLGRPGFRSQGLMQGGAADPLALLELAALLNQPVDLACIEMAGIGGTFEVTEDCVIGLTGAEMDVRIDGLRLSWNATHTLPAGVRLSIGGARRGTYGYLGFAGGVDAPMQMGARSRHLNARIGTVLTSGQRFPLGETTRAKAGQLFEPDDRLSGGTVRIVPSMQTANFEDAVRQRFSSTRFRKDARANRMGVRMDHDGEGFFASDTLSIVSEVIAIGDIQITGDGAPFVLLCECQTTGGYPRIGTVIPSDLSKVAQANTGTDIRFEFITVKNAIEIEKAARARDSSLKSRLRPLLRDPRDIHDLLGYQLVSGAVSATADPFEMR